MRLEGRVAVVTGGASGLGRATAVFLARERGMRVALLDLPASDGAALASELGPSVASFHGLDVADEGRVAAALSSVLARWGAVHVCLNAAGVPGSTRMLSRDGAPVGGAVFERTLAVNVAGTFHVMTHCAAAFARNDPDEDGERGVVVNVASIAAFEGTLGHVAYSASKAAVIGMMLPAARELAPRGIRVLTIAPGLFLTAMAGSVSDKVLAAMTSAIVYPKRPGRLEEFAELFAHLCENRYLNAEVVRIDAATRLAGP